MIRLGGLLWAIVLACSAVWAMAGEPEGDKNIARAQQLAAFDAGRKWAVLIGVNTYLDPTISSLKYCVADARQLAETLVRRCGYEEPRILILTDDQPEEHFRPLGFNLRKQINLFLRNVQVGDTVLVFFSGHGFLDAQGQAFLAPKDCDRDNLGLTAFRADDLRDQLAQCRATQKMLVLDCCHAGSAKSGESPGLSGAELGRAFRDARGLITLASCKRDETSQEWQEKGHGLFTHYLVQGLEGAADFDRNGLVDSDELYRYTSDQVPLTAQRMNAQQTPVRFIPPDVVGVFAMARSLPLSLPPSIPSTAVAQFTVRKDGPEGGPIEDAEVSIWHRPSGQQGTTRLAAGRTASDGHVDLPGSYPTSNLRDGTLVVTVAFQGQSKTWSLIDFPNSQGYLLTIPVGQAPSYSTAGASGQGGSTDGFISLFDGRTLTGWTAEQNPGFWSVRNGALVGRGRSGSYSYLFHQSQFSDFELVADVKINRDGNSGLFFRAFPGSRSPAGFEIQILGSAMHGTGGMGDLHDRVRARTNPVQDDVWFTMHLIAQGSHITLSIDGTAVLNCDSTDYRTGHICLQWWGNEGADTEVWFRNIRVRPLR
jgi:hypothetical protein